MAGKGFTGQPGLEGSISSQESEGCTWVAKAPQSPSLQQGGSNSAVYLPYPYMLSFILGHYFAKFCLPHLHTQARTRMQACTCTHRHCTRMYTRTCVHKQGTSGVNLLDPKRTAEKERVRSWACLSNTFQSELDILLMFICFYVGRYSAVVIKARDLRNIHTPPQRVFGFPAICRIL